MKDEKFIRGKNPMTKMEVRNTIISYLELENAKNALDIGAGTGSVTVQMALQYPQLNVYGIEKTDTGCALIADNAKKHKVSIKIIEDVAPTSKLESSIQFDRVYIGGTGKNMVEIMHWLETKHLENDAIVVFSVITLESLSEIMTYLENHKAQYSNIEGSLIQASRLDTLGSYHYFNPLNPCYIIKCQFGGNHA